MFTPATAGFSEILDDDALLLVEALRSMRPTNMTAVVVALVGTGYWPNEVIPVLIEVTTKALAADLSGTTLTPEDFDV